MKERLTRILVQQNPWLERGSVRRWFLKHLPGKYRPRTVSLIADQRVTVILGPPRVGKATLVWKSLEARGRPVLYLDCREPLIQEWLQRPLGFLSDLVTLPGSVQTLFLRGIQHLSQPRERLRELLANHSGLRVLATGCGPEEIRQGGGGRDLRILTLGPLGLEELSGLGGAATLMADRSREQEIDRALVRGALPEVVTAARPAEVLVKLVEQHVIQPLIGRFRLRQCEAFRDLLELMAGRIGQLANHSDWGDRVGVSNDTAGEYARILAQTQVVRMVPPFAGGRRTEICKAPRVFFTDCGVRNVLCGGFEPAERRADREDLLRALVLEEIRACLDPACEQVRYWRTKSGAGVDFVILGPDRRAACHVRGAPGRLRLDRGARSFVQAYEPELFLLVTNRTGPEQTLGRTRVRFVRPWQVRSELQAWRELQESAPQPEPRQGLLPGFGL